MAGFGDWLQATKLTLSEIEFLRDIQIKVGQSWPIASQKKLEYEKEIRNTANIDHLQAITALYRAWEVFELENKCQNITVQRPGFWDRFTMSAPTLAVTVPGGILLLIFCVGLANSNLADTESARGIITLLFSVTTVVVAIIITLSNFLGTTDTAESEKRFQRGKDILTVLIGVFGAILGYYFGTEKSSSKSPPAQQADRQASAENKPPITPADKSSQPAPAVDKSATEKDAKPGKPSN